MASRAASRTSIGRWSSTPCGSLRPTRSAPPAASGSIARSGAISCPRGARVAPAPLRLDASHKIRPARGKWLHRQVWRNFLPPRIRGRKKRGFAVNVVDGWFHSRQQGPLSEILLDSTSLIFQSLIPERVRLLLKEHQSGRQDNHKLLFSLVVFELWLRGAANGANAVPRPAAGGPPEM